MVRFFGLKQAALEAEMERSLIGKLFIDYLGVSPEEEGSPQSTLRKAWNRHSSSCVAHLQPLAQVLIDYEERGLPVSHELIDQDHPRWPNTRPDVISAINGQLAQDDGPLGQAAIAKYVRSAFDAIDLELERKAGDEDEYSQLTDLVRDSLGYDRMIAVNPDCHNWLERCLDAYQAAWLQAKSDFLDPALTSRITAWRTTRNKKAGAPFKPTRYVVVHTKSTSPRLFTYACWWANQQEGPHNIIAVVAQPDGHVVLSTGMHLEGLKESLPGLLVNEPRRGFIPLVAQPDGAGLAECLRRAIENGSAFNRPIISTSPMTNVPRQPTPRPTAEKPTPTRPTAVLAGQQPSSTRFQENRRDGRPVPHGKKPVGLTHNPFAALADLKLNE